MELDEKTQAMLDRKLQLKYVIDRVSGLVLLLVSSPVIALCAILIKWDGWVNPENRGPVFYTEPRISRKRLFHIVKFRTVPQRQVDWVRERPNERTISGSSVQTWAGRIILRWYLDELPQLFNILKGEMSLVGPRPHTVFMTQQANRQGAGFRQTVKAGLLGIPQACKHNPKYEALLWRMERAHRDTDSAIRHLDALYIRRCKDLPLWRFLLFDLGLIFRCLLVVLRGEKKMSEGS